MEHDVFQANGVRVEWVELGEGMSGDYDPDDPNDVELLRFDVYVSEALATELDKQFDGTDIDGETWYPPQDSSYCTRVPASTPPDKRQHLLRIIHREIGHPPNKRDMERMSWIDGEGKLT